jgi:hypothetical protein
MAWNATHRVPDGGLPSFVNNQPSTPLDPGLEVEVAERSGDWARVVASNGRECWVAGGTLVPLAAAAAPVAAVAAAGPPPAGPPPTPPADLPPQAPPATPAAAGPPPTPPPYQTGQPPPKRRSGPPWIPILIGVIILLVVGAAGGGYFFLNANAADVALEMANAQSSQPFAPSIAPAPASSPSPSAAPAASPQPPPKGPNGVAIYGGSGSNSVCDKQKLIDFLTTHSAEARAWAGVEGISTAQISDFIRPLTPEILSRDVRVTNHGFSNSRATTYQSVFQAGTAVLVNQSGYPVARCLCGNPLTPPVSSKRYHYTGQQWPGFNQTTIIIYVAPPGNAPNVPTPVATPTATPGPTAQQLTAVAAQVYHSDGSTCSPLGSSPGTTSYSSCPFTSGFAQTLAAAQQAEIRAVDGFGGGADLLCHCQAAATDYAVSSAQPSGSGGTANVSAGYFGGGNVPMFILTVVSENGQLLVSNIHVQGASCATPAPIAAAPC